MPVLAESDWLSAFHILSRRRYRFGAAFAPSFIKALLILLFWSCLSILGVCVKCDMQDGLLVLPLVVSPSTKGEKQRMMVE